MKHHNHLDAVWRVHVANLLKEILDCGGPNVSIMKVPFKILGEILYEVGECAARINDDELNSLMCRLAIYEISDFSNPNHDKELTRKVIRKGLLVRQKRLSPKTQAVKEFENLKQLK